MNAQYLLDNGSTVVGLLSFAILTLSVFHDWGYFWVVGLRFQSMQTPYDYLANSIEWLPLHLGGLIFTGLVSWVSILLGRTDNDYLSGVQRSKNRRWMWAPTFAVALAAIFAAVMFMVQPTPPASNVALLLGGLYAATVVAHR
jgi:hypothetical protein